MPYASGPLPVKPMGDIFNHLPHGLFGAIVVEPKGARYKGRKEDSVSADEVRVTIDPKLMLPSAAITLTEGFTSRTASGQTIEVAPPQHAIREHVLFWQDGLNLQERRRDGSLHPVADCHVCDDSYDFGKRGVSYRSTPFFARFNLRGTNPYTDGSALLNGAADLNAVVLPEQTWHIKGTGGSRTPIVLDAVAGEEVMIRVVHPGGRARQRAFLMSGNGFDDLFPGFGFPNAALLAPGKAVTAALRRPVSKGCHLWQDGPRLMVGHGVWGLLDVRESETGAPSCPVAP